MGPLRVPMMSFAPEGVEPPSAEGPAGLRPEGSSRFATGNSFEALSEDNASQYSDYNPSGLESDDYSDFDPSGLEPDNYGNDWVPQDLPSDYSGSLSGSEVEPDYSNLQYEDYSNMYYDDDRECWLPRRDPADFRISILEKRHKVDGLQSIDDGYEFKTLFEEGVTRQADVYAEADTYLNAKFGEPKFNKFVKPWKIFRSNRPIEDSAIKCRNDSSLIVPRERVFYDYVIKMKRLRLALWALLDHIKAFGSSNPRKSFRLLHRIISEVDFDQGYLSTTLGGSVKRRLQSQHNAIHSTLRLLKRRK